MTDFSRIPVAICLLAGLGCMGKILPAGGLGGPTGAGATGAGNSAVGGSGGLSGVGGAAGYEPHRCSSTVPGRGRPGALDASPDAVRVQQLGPRHIA